LSSKTVVSRYAQRLSQELIVTE